MVASKFLFLLIFSFQFSPLLSILLLGFKKTKGIREDEYSPKKMSPPPPTPHNLHPHHLLLTMKVVTVFLPSINPKGVDVTERARLAYKGEENCRSLYNMSVVLPTNQIIHYCSCVSCNTNNCMDMPNVTIAEVLACPPSSACDWNKQWGKQRNNFYLLLFLPFFSSFSTMCSCFLLFQSKEVFTYGFFIFHSSTDAYKKSCMKQ